MNTKRKHPLSAKSVYIGASDLLALISSTGYLPAEGRAELDLERPAQEGEQGYIDVQTYIAVLAQELLRCRSDLVKVQRQLEELKK